MQSFHHRPARSYPFALRTDDACCASATRRMSALAARDRDREALMKLWRRSRVPASNMAGPCACQAVGAGWLPSYRGGAGARVCHSKWGLGDEKIQRRSIDRLAQVSTLKAQGTCGGGRQVYGWRRRWFLRQCTQGNGTPGLFVFVVNGTAVAQHRVPKVSHPWSHRLATCCGRPKGWAGGIAKYPPGC